VARKKRRPIHARIVELRERAELTQAQLAEIIGVGRDVVWHWENGDSAPRASRLPDLADALGVDVDTLLRDLVAA